MTSRTSRTVLALVIVGALLRAERAQACKVPSPVPHVVDPSKQTTDMTAPAPPTVRVQKIKRGQGPQGSGCSSTVTSCDDMGTVTLSITATDNDTPPEAIGFRIQLVAGRLPEGLTLPGDSRPLSPPDLNGQVAWYLHWGDGATDDQESFDFTLSVRSVDLAGNASEPATVRVSDDPSGCSVGGAGRGAPALLLLAMAILVRRRRFSGPR